jgi:hypothetical protein
MNRFKILKGIESPCFAPIEKKKRSSPQRADIQALVGRADYRGMGNMESTSYGWANPRGSTGIEGYTGLTTPRSEAPRDFQFMHGINLEE